MDIHVDIRGFLKIHVWICYRFSEQGSLFGWSYFQLLTTLCNFHTRTTSVILESVFGHRVAYFSEQAYCFVSSP